MSVEYYLYCAKDHSAVWIGCDGLSGYQFPYKAEGLMEDIGDFLREHHVCRLTHESEHTLPDGTALCESGTVSRVTGT